MAINYDQYGRVRNIYRPVPIQPMSNFSRPAEPDANLFERINNVVENIGRWIEGSGYPIASYLGVAFIAVVWIFFAICAVNMWIDNGIGSFLLFAIFGGFVTYFISMIAGGFIIIGLTVVVAIFRYIFYNLITLLIALAIFAFIGFRSCSSSSESVDATEQVANYEGNDAAVYGLVGKVRSVYENNDGKLQKIASFNADGQLQTLYGRNIEEVKKIERDSEGFITSMTDVEATEMDGGHDVVTYTWKNGQIASSTSDSPEGQTKTVYTYDNDGNLIKTHTTGFQGDKVNITETYKYTKFDDHGNWTARTIKHKEGRRTKRYKEKRTITYWNKQ